MLVSSAKKSKTNKASGYGVRLLASDLSTAKEGIATGCNRR